MNNRLTELIEQKSFNELSKQEKRFVLNDITEQEYKEKYQLIYEVKRELKLEASVLKVNDSIRVSAIEALLLKQKEKKPGVFIRFTRFKVPLWTAVAALFLIFILSTPILINTELKNDTKNNLLASIDTVYIDKIIKDTIQIIKPGDTVIQKVYVSKKDYPSKEEGTLKLVEYSNLKSDQSQKDLEREMAIGGYINTIDFYTPKSGKSLSDDRIGRILLNVSN